MVTITPKAVHTTTRLKAIFNLTETISGACLKMTHQNYFRCIQMHTSYSLRLSQIDSCNRYWAQDSKVYPHQANQMMKYHSKGAKKFWVQSLMV